MPAPRSSAPPRALPARTLLPEPGRAGGWEIEIQIAHYLRELNSFDLQVVIAFTIVVTG